MATERYIKELIGDVETALLHATAAATAMKKECTIEFANMRITANPAAEGKLVTVTYKGTELVMQDLWFLEGLVKGINMNVRASFTKSIRAEFVVNLGDNGELINNRYHEALKAGRG